MSRDFTKNTANYLSFGTGAVGALLNGASKISFCAWVNADALDAGGTINTILHFKINGASSGLYMGVDDNGSGGAKTLRVGGRSVSTDGFQSVRGTTTINTGTSYLLGGVLDIGGDTITLYINGAVEAGPTAVTFGNATWTYGTATAGDMVGSNTTPPSGTTNQWDGAIGEVAVWTDDIGADGFLELAQKASPIRVRREALAFYSKLIGNDAVERDIVSGLSGTITGTVGPLPHFPIVYPRRRTMRKWSAATAAVLVKRLMMLGVGA